VKWRLLLSAAVTGLGDIYLADFPGAYLPAGNGLPFPEHLSLVKARPLGSRNQQVLPGVVAMTTGLSEAAKLWRLQQLDITLRSWKQAAAAPEQEEEHGRLTTLVRQTLKQLKAEEAALMAANQALRRNELDLSTLEQDIRQLKERLYSGQVTNTRELASIEQKLQLSKEKHEHLEERVLELMQQVEDGDKETRHHRTQAEQLAGRLRDLEDTMKAEADQRRQKVAQATAERAALAAKLDPTWLRRYEKAMKQRGPDVVARVENGLCGGCRVSLPFGIRAAAAAATESAVYCEHCGRMLYSP
jgi:predicted  nucleic acid-binding Zn-ribbon protein